MSVEIMAQVWKLDLPVAEKMVLLALADAANDEGVCWPSVAGKRGSRNPLTVKCSLSERSVQGAIKRLVQAGHLERFELPGKGVRYTVHPVAMPLFDGVPQPANPRKSCTPAESAPPQNTAQTPAESAPKPSKNHHTLQKGDKPLSSGRAAPTDRLRGCRLPDGWKPDDEAFPETLSDRIRQLVPADDIPAWLQDQIDGFVDFWAAKAGANATKLNWDRAFHGWLRKELNGVRQRNWARQASTQRVFGTADRARAGA